MAAAAAAASVALAVLLLVVVVVVMPPPSPILFTYVKCDTVKGFFLGYTLIYIFRSFPSCAHVFKAFLEFYDRLN